MTAKTAVQAAQACPRCESEFYATLFRATDRLYGTTDRKFNVVECGSCGLIYLDPLPTPEELKGFYPQNYWFEADESAEGRLTEIYRRFVLDDHARFALKGIEPPGPVLDIGCGSGLFLQAAEKRGYQVAGSDVSARAADMCRRNHRIPAVCASLPHLPFHHGVFSGATMFHVLEHLYDPVAAVSELWRLLPPGGRLIIQVPNAACWQMMLLGDRWSGLDVPRHLINFRDEDLEELLDYCGFDVVRRKFFSLRDNPAGLATSLAPSLEPVARKVRGIEEGRWSGLLKNLLYLGLTVAAVPFTLLEAAGSAGSTVMVEAVRREGA